MKTAGLFLLMIAGYDYYSWLTNQPGPLEMILHTIGWSGHPGSWLNPGVAAIEFVAGLAFPEPVDLFRRRYLEWHFELTRALFERLRYWRAAQAGILFLSALAVLRHMDSGGLSSPTVRLFWIPLGLGLNSLLLRYVTANFRVAEEPQGEQS